MPDDRIPIGAFSRITRLSQKALRLYDERGLLVPAARDVCTGYRYYTFAQIERGVLIRHLLWLGFGLSEIATILAARDGGDAGAVQEHFVQRLGATEQEILRLQTIAAILRAQDPLDEMFRISLTEPVVKDVPATRVLARREAVPGAVEALHAEEGRQPAAEAAGPKPSIDRDGADRKTGTGLRIGKAYERIFAYTNEHRLAPVGPSGESFLDVPGEVPEDEIDRGPVSGARDLHPPAAGG